MKIIILCFIIYILNNISLFGQCNDCKYKSDEIWISVENHLNIQKKDGTISTNDEKLDHLFVKYRVQKIEQVFPYSKIDRLKKLYKVKFDGTRDDFILELQKNEVVKKVTKRQVENKIAVYDPSDYMWYLPTVSDPNGWLWHLKRIQADKAWDITKGSPNIKIASIDTWFDINHPDLTNKISPKYDPYDNTAYTSDCFKENHGTSVVSFIAGETDGGGQLASVGFNCMLVCYQAWAGSYIERAHNAAMAMHVDVITSSAGGWSCTDVIDDDDKLAVKEILDNGTIIVMPAGNGLTSDAHCYYGGRDHPFKPLSPEYDNRVIVVTSTGIDDKHQYLVNGVDHTHSHYPEVDICAPDYNVMGAICTKSLDTSSNTCVANTWPYYGSITGTSFATPIVAGVCALMKSINPCLTPQLAKSIIQSTADPVVDASSYPGLVGAGRINAFNAVKLAGTKSITGSIGGTTTYSAGYVASLSNVAVQSNSNITVKARKEITVNGTSEVPIGSTVNFTIDSNAVNSCN